MKDVILIRYQIDLSVEITSWYLRYYYQPPFDIGLPQMFCDEAKVGHFAVDAARLAAGDGDALFRLLVTMTMFQRRSDAQIMRVLRGISRDAADEMTSSSRLLSLA